MQTQEYLLKQSTTNCLVGANGAPSWFMVLFPVNGEPWQRQPKLQPR